MGVSRYYPNDSGPRVHFWRGKHVALACAGLTIGGVYLFGRASNHKQIQARREDFYERGRRRIVIVGKPGAGKTTIAQQLAKEYEVAFVGEDHVLQNEIAKKSSSMGLRIKEAMENGELVDDSVTSHAINNRLLQKDAETHGALVDGYPRSKEHVNAMRVNHLLPHAMVHLNVSNKTSLQRCSTRLQDPVTGRVYNSETNPPPSDIKDRCVPAFNEKIFAKKLKAYEEETEDMLNTLASHDDLTIHCNVDGEGSIEDVKLAVDACLRNKVYPQYYLVDGILKHISELKEIAF